MKKSKRLISIILALVMILSSMQVVFAIGADKADSIEVATISDIRYQANAADREGLLLSKSAAILDAAVENVKNSSADVLLVTGDLTNNGNKQSHEYVAKKLMEVKEMGIPVFVIPGEHDVREGGTVTAVSKPVFEGIYKEFGYSEPKQDPTSASYVAELDNGYAVVMSDSVAADGQGQMTQWVVDQAKAGIASGKTVFAASHHPIATRGSVDRTFIDLLHSVAAVEIDLGGKHRLFTEDPKAAAAKLGLVDRSCVLSNGTALVDAGVKYLFSGHGATLSVAGVATQSGAQLYDIMSGSLVNASASVRYTTLYKGQNAMKQQRADFRTEMITSAKGVDNVEAAAHAALKKQMPREVDYAVEKAEKVITYILPAMKPNVINLIRNLDVAALAPDMAGLLNILGGTIQSVKDDLAYKYVGPLFDILGNQNDLHNIILDLRAAFEKMDFNGQDLYGFLTDVFVTIQKGDGKAPASVEGIFQSIRDKDGALLSGMVRSFADNFDSTNFVNLINKVLDHKFSGKYLGTLNLNVQLRGMLAGPYNVTSGIYTYTLDLWNMLDTSVVLPNGKKVSQVVRPLVNDLILGAPNNASTKQTPQRFNNNLRNDADQIVNLLFEFNVGDMIGNDVFAQGQKGQTVAKTTTLDELGAVLNRLAPSTSAPALNASDWNDVRDALNAAGRFSAADLARVNKVLVPANTQNNTPAFTQLDKLKELLTPEFYQAVAAEFSSRVNALPATESLTIMNDAQNVWNLETEYIMFYGAIRNNISAATVERLDAAAKKIRALLNYDPQVESVIQQIAQLGKVTAEDEQKVLDARNAYKQLSPRQKNAVTNYQDLVKAEEALKLAKENAAVIKAVEDKITEIGVVEFTAASKRKIDAADRAYNDLAPELRESVKNRQDLFDAQARYEALKGEKEDLKKAQPVIDMIDDIGIVTLRSKDKIEKAEKAYGLLTENQQKLVSNHQKLLDARRDYDALVLADQGEKAKVKAVEDKIDEIGPVDLQSGEKIKAARDAYNELSPELKDLVKNYTTLVNAENTFKALQKEHDDELKASAVEALIEDIGDVSIEKADKITAARDAYNKLTADQKRLVSNFNKLRDAETLLSVLKKDFLFEDGATGITVRADSGVVPADTIMTVKHLTSGDTYDAVMAQGYIKINLYDIALTSQGKKVTPSKDVKIAVPQFSEKNKIFAVAQDGRLTEVNAALENGVFAFTNANVGKFVVVEERNTVNEDALKAAIASYEELVPANYAEADFAKATVAYEAAKVELDAHYALTAANQRKVDLAAAILVDAIDGLTIKAADAAKLRIALYEAKALNEDDYMNFAAVANAVAAADSFLAGSYDARSQAKIDKLTNDITNAVAALELRAADFSFIDAALARVPKDLQNYTEDSRKALEAAMTEAETAKSKITRKDKDWKAQVEAKAKAIDDAVAALVPVGATANSADLVTALKIADLYYPADYVDFSGVEIAVLSAKEVIAAKTSSQAAYDSAETAIYDAINALEWA